MSQKPEIIQDLDLFVEYGTTPYLNIVIEGHLTEMLMVLMLRYARYNVSIYVHDLNNIYVIKNSKVEKKQEVDLPFREAGDNEILLHTLSGKYLYIKFK